MIRNYSQLDHMESELMQVLKSIIITTTFSWVGIYSFLGKAPEILWPILGFVYFLLTLVLIRKLNRAHQFYWLIAVLAIINSILVFDSSIKLIFFSRSLNNLPFSWLETIGFVMTIFGFWSQIQLKRIQLRDSLAHNIKSGRLELTKGYWNLNVPLHFDVPTSELNKTKRLRQLSRLSPIVTALGLAIARVLDGGLQIVGFGVCLYILGCVIAWGCAKYLAIAFQLLEWEKEYNIRIKI